MALRRFALPALLAVMVMVFAVPSFANDLTSATGVVSCANYSLTFSFANLAPGTSYTVDFTVTLTPSSGPAVVITPSPSGTFTFTATSSTQTEGPISFTIPSSIANTLTGPYTLSGSATLTSSGSTQSIVFSPSTLSCATGRFTGGGKEIDLGGSPANVAITQGLELDCDLNPSYNLEINWEGNHFHLENFTFAACSFVNNPAPPRAPINTMDGQGTGRFDGVDGYTIVFTLVDNGEPGVNDMACFEIYAPGDAPDLSGNPTCQTLHGTSPGDVLDLPLTNLTFGNLQAHPDQR